MDSYTQVYFPRRQKKEMEADYLLWLNRKGGYEQYVDQVVNIFVTYIPGVQKTHVDRVVEEILEWQKGRVHRFTRDLIQKLKQKRYYLIAISGSPHFIASKFVHYMGFDASFGSCLEIKENTFTGKILSTDSWNKKPNVLNAFLKEANISSDLSHSLAVGDTESEIPILEMVGYPIAFNPNQALAQYAKKKQWRIVVERKDVIYDIHDFSFTI